MVAGTTDVRTVGLKRRAPRQSRTGNRNLGTGARKQGLNG